MTRQIELFLIVSLLFATAIGCKSKKPSEQAGETNAPATAAQKEPAPAGVQFGSDDQSFIRWMQRDGKFAVLYRFDKDTNGDGEVTVQLGDHGEPEGDWPTVTTVEIASGETEVWDAVVTLGALGEWVVMQKGDKLVALSARKRWTIEGADLRENKSPCLPSRKASIEPSGTWMTYLKTDPTRAVVKNLDSGEEREVPVDSELWRADPTPTGWVVTREVLEDTNGDGKLEWPYNEGSCACSWCNRFAKSVGSARMAGDQTTTVLIDPDGNRHLGFVSPLPITKNRVWEISTNDLFTPEREPVPVAAGKGCGVLAVPLGSEKMVVRCGPQVSIWDPETREGIGVDEQLDAVELYVPPRDGWIAVRINAGNGVYNLGRLNVNDGRVESGPPATIVGASHPSGWLLGSDGEKVHAFDINTGQSTTLEMKANTLSALAAQTPSGWVVVDPTNGKAESLEQRPAFIASNGCYIEPHPMNQPVKGPFTYSCP